MKSDVKRILIDNISPDNSDLKRRTAHNAAWSTISMSIRVLLTILSMPVLARLLSPEDFGVAALATLVTEVVVLFGEFGLQSALIQRKKVYRLDLNTAFWSEFGLSILLAAFLVVTAEYFAIFFNQAVLDQVLYVTAVGIVLTSLTVVHRTVLARTMNFKVLSIIEITSSISRTSCAIMLAFIGYGFWSLVIAALIGFIVTAVMRFYYFPWIPTLRFSSARFKRMFSYGKHIFADNLLNYFSSNMDLIVIGKRLGTEALGYYQIAFTIPDLVRKNTQQVLTRVLFPSYSRVQDEPERLKKGFFSTISSVALITFPALFGLAAIAPTFIPFYFGEQWSSIIIPVQLLCIAASARTIMAMCGPLIHARGRPDLTMKMSAVRIPFLFLVLTIGSYWGIYGVALSVMIFFMLWMLIFLYISTRIINAKFTESISHLFAPALASLMMALVVWNIQNYLLENDFGLLFILTLSVFLGVIIYSFSSYIMFKKALYEFLDIVKSMLNKKHSTMI